MIRIGLGHDTHRLGSDQPLVIGGVTIPHTTGPIAHSDGDVLLHALIDALIGAAGLGDIGEWFPDTDPAYKGADSAPLLDQVLTRLTSMGYRVINVDAIIFAQRPRLSPRKQDIREHVARLLSVSAEQVNIKAKTGEHVGPIGREEAIAAEVAVLIESTQGRT
ncbi:MAG: 2-C-methyl-D-erythritol 2,4-cyclodiphosphate synthase [Planctomycetaceae bacterium]